MSMENPPLAERVRLEQDARRERHWKLWGPYLSARQWGTVREDYSADGDCWSYLPHDHARSKAYRWGEDGLLGICDDQCRLCFALAMWNGRDPILKERLFGLTGPEGNHGEDVKECYYFLESTPTHSYMKALYKYPQDEYPYARLVEENRRRSRREPEFELIDTGVFDQSRYFDIYVEYAKNSPDDILVKITVANRGPEMAPLHLLPTLWFRNTWAWGSTGAGQGSKPWMKQVGPSAVEVFHSTLGRWRWEVEPQKTFSPPELLFTENDSNLTRLYNVTTSGGYVKDAFHEYVLYHRSGAISTRHLGTKSAAMYLLDVPAGESVTVRLRLFSTQDAPARGAFDAGFEEIFKQRIRECNEFYEQQIPTSLPREQRNVARQAYAGLLWSKQFYHYSVKEWLNGDPMQPPPPKERLNGRNADWQHLASHDVLSIPDTWEYPWFASWNLAFHMIPLATVDGQCAREQLELLLEDRYMHPGGQLPAHEFSFGDVDPPVHAWGCWNVYKMSGSPGQRDRGFLARTFEKLLVNFNWWMERRDMRGRQISGGGFLGLDNIGIFDRSQLLSTAHLERADGTAWMAFFCGSMLSISLELAETQPEYEPAARRLLEQFITISDALHTMGGRGLWDEEDGFYYDHVRADGRPTPLKIRSVEGLIPLFAVEVLDRHLINRLSGFRERLDVWFQDRHDLKRQLPSTTEHRLQLLAIPTRQRLERVLRYVLDENEFLSSHGVRSLSKVHESRPYRLDLNGQKLSVRYVPGESDVPLFGGNPNWRGPVWLPVNYLLIESLQRYGHFYGDSLRVECPTGSGRMMNLSQVAHELSRRVASLFLPDHSGHRPCHGGEIRYASDPHWDNLVLFHEYFHGESGRGLGASHQTGWTALVTCCLGCASSTGGHSRLQSPGPLPPIKRG
jgi:hypothetical protein